MSVQNVMTIHSVFVAIMQSAPKWCPDQQTVTRLNNRMTMTRGQLFIIDVKYMVLTHGNYSCFSASGRSVIRTAIPSGV